ncbi:MAG: sugar O-acetyltransferase [Eubacterium sp.]|nr:sugar O-acetyltransferase [Butyrivibrio sp.]MBP3718667.1 sugar O-acetyltransferase [Eubacterium sp.]MBR1772429.1 sugar O-acetyltransferase [Eubacterium sp.]
MTEIEKLEAGLEYCYDDPDAIARKVNALNQCRKFNDIDDTDFEAQYEQLKAMLGSVGEKVWIAKTFNCDNGQKIHIGNNFTGNHNLTILDIREVYIGDNVMIGPHTLITTVGHSLSPMSRRKHMAFAKPVHIGNDVWIGGNVTILPGVTIGNNVVVAAGAVVTEDIPDNCLVGGVPARKIKDIEDDTQYGDKDNNS